MGAEAYEDYRRALHDPATVHAMCEDYRAGLGVDREHDDADREAGRRVACPVQVLWAPRDDMVDLYGDVLGVWREWMSGRLEGGPIESGHHIAEEAPEELVRALCGFWRPGEGPGPDPPGRSRVRAGPAAGTRTPRKRPRAGVRAVARPLSDRAPPRDG